MTTPHSIIRFYDVYDLTPNYQHTRFFETDDIRDAYFYRHIATDNSGTPYDFTVQHIRVDKGEIKVPFPIKDIHQFCYMSIRNSSYNNDFDHTYYCFIKDMEYVSDSCTLIYFEVDVMQTYFNSINNWYGMVERTHSETDTFGDNIKAEPFNPTEFLVNDNTYDWCTYDMTLVVAIATADSSITFEYIDGGGNLQTYTIDMTPSVYYANTFTFVKYVAFDSSLFGSALFLGFLNYFLANDAEKAKEIVDIYACPSICVPPIQGSGFIEIGTTEATPQTIDSEIKVVGTTSTLNTIDGYTPNNMKMYCYPFNFLRVTNGEGQDRDYAFEYFDIRHASETPEFVCEGNFIGEPSLALYPKKYKRKTTAITNTGNHQTTNLDINYNDAVTLTGYPHSAWTADYYAMYQSQNKTANAVKNVGSTMLGGLVGLGLFGAGALTFGMGGAIGASLLPNILAMTGIGTATGSVIGGIKEDVNLLAESIRAKNTADVMFGNTVDGGLPQAHNHKTFEFYRMTVDRQYAKMVDDFFTMYGYATNEIMNIRTHLLNVKTARRHYCYIKCTNFIIQGGIENKYKAILYNILNTGITFWYKNSSVDTDPIGDYSVDNRVIVG